DATVHGGLLPALDALHSSEMRTRWRTSDTELDQVHHSGVGQGLGATDVAALSTGAHAVSRRSRQPWVFDRRSPSPKRSMQTMGTSLNNSTNGARNLPTSARALLLVVGVAASGVAGYVAAVA